MGKTNNKNYRSENGKIKIDQLRTRCTKLTINKTSRKVEEQVQQDETGFLKESWKLPNNYSTNTCVQNDVTWASVLLTVSLYLGII